jgi:hypothetical protein
MRKLLIVLALASLCGGQVINVRHRGGAPPPSDTEAITGQTTSSAINNQTVFAGISILVGGSGITVTELGRWVIAGNSASHLLTLTDSSGTSLGSCTVNTSGAPTGDYLYCALGSPVALSALGSYKVLSAESNGGDQWYSNSSVTFTSAITGAAGTTGTISGANCSGCTAWETSPTTYVPVNFKYH